MVYSSVVGGTWIEPKVVPPAPGQGGVIPIQSRHLRLSGG